MHDRTPNGTGKPVQSRPGTSRAESEPSRRGMERSAENASAVGAGPELSSGERASKALANPVSQRTQCFLFDAQGVRVVGTVEAPRFVAKDVCAVLEIENHRDTLAKCLEDDEKGVETIYTLGGPQEMSVVNESGLYALIFRSRKPQARLFRRWVTSEVLPAIRKTGSYTVMAPAALPAFADKIIEIHHKAPEPVTVPTEEAMLCELLGELLGLARSRAVVHAHTLVDFAERHGGFVAWLGKRDDYQRNAKFMCNLARYFSRWLVGHHHYRYYIQPESYGRSRRYVITSGTVATPVAAISRADGDKAVAVVAEALAAGEEVIVK